MINVGTSNLGEEGDCVIIHFRVTAYSPSVKKFGWELKAGAQNRNHAGGCFLAPSLWLVLQTTLT